MLPKGVFLILLLVGSLAHPALAFPIGDLLEVNENKNSFSELSSGIINIPEKMFEQSYYKRYLIFGKGNLPDINSYQLNSITSSNGIFSIAVLPEDHATSLRSQGYHVVEDMMIEPHAQKHDYAKDISRIGEITGSQTVQEQYNYTGKGIRIGIVDTGVDFSNPDIQLSLARDKKNFPIMLDADGQGIVLTNATFIADIGKDGSLRNYTKKIPENVTSTVYKNKKGVFLDIANGGKGTTIPIYNSFFPQAGPSPVFNGTLGDDMKIGKDGSDYIQSKSGIYRLGVIYQGALQGPFTRIQVVPVLVVDSKTSGIYDTIIPDMSTSWEDYTRFDLPRGKKPNYDFDFTDERPIILGGKNEFLLYDFDKDGRYDYSAGTVGAQVVDVYGVITNKTAKIDDKLKALNGTALPHMDSKGQFFGIMNDFVGHGTSSAASIVSKGLQEYDIYNNTKKYTIRGVAPDAKIIPVKALWLGDSVYAWLWLAGFDSAGSDWKYNGSPRVDIISNSWGISSFPNIRSLPGTDILSLIVNVLSTPQSVEPGYPGVTIVSSAGNSGHGYGTIGLPNSASLGISVGATTNNVFVGYGPFSGQPRFGNTTEHMNHVVDFSSRGPGIIGDPKPDLMSIGAHSFTPSTVLKLKKDSKQEPFSLFGGTSMAAPLVSGSAALLMQALNENKIEYDSFKIKNILMSTATDIKNDPFTQGSGLVNVTNAIGYVKGEDEIFIVYNDASYTNVKNILDGPLSLINSTTIGLEQFWLPHKVFPQTSWFAGHLLPGERSTATFTIENPSSDAIEVKITPQNLQLLRSNQFEGTTTVHQQDPILNKSGVYSPNYIKLSDVHPFQDLGSFFETANPIPEDSELMILDLNFPFETFMNKTDKTFANDMRISSLYLYDWADKNNDTKISSDELSMVNRGGSWGTVQEVRVTDPKEKFSDTPLVGVYPVPTRYSYWLGDTTKNSTSMNYTLSASYYKKDKWDLVWTSHEKIIVLPKSSKQISATIVAPSDYKTGVYQGFLKFEGARHSANVPVSFVIKQPVNQKESIITLEGKASGDVLYGPGYIKGSFDMVNRYMAGDWRQYYFDIRDPSVNVGAIEFSWKNKDSNLAVFVSDPKGRMVQTNMPSGVFGHFMGWPSIDWLGTTPFSQGGGFFPVKNKDETSTVLFVPINQTGTYSMLVHSTLFGGNSTTEPIKVAAKFTSITPDIKIPEISAQIPEYLNKNFELPQLFEDETFSANYYLDDRPVEYDSINLEELEEGQHELKVVAIDPLGKNHTKSFSFYLDNSQPQILPKSPKQNSIVSDSILIDFDVSDASLPEKQALQIILPDGSTIKDQKTYIYDTANLQNGDYEISITVTDRAQNQATHLIKFNVDHSIPDEPSTSSDLVIENTSLLIGVVAGLAIGAGSLLVITKNLRNSKKT